ncbi:unnamed protein product [Trichobilharzia regenti]|nr:unnamed protein product [Trichobilharzia regenti]
MPSVHQTSVDKSPPQDSRSFKAIQKEREEYGLKYSQSQTSFSKYDNVLSSTSQSVPTGLSDKIIGSENLYTSVELSHSPIEVSKKSKSKKSKRERKDREKESSKIRGDDIPLKYSKKESKQRKVHHSSSTTSELDQTTKWRESDQKYEKMISSAVRHDRLPHPVKIKHKHKSDKRETMTTTTTGAAPAAAVPVDNNYPTNLLYKREKISQDIIESHQDILIEESYKHHKKSKLSKNTEIEAIASRHKKHSSKRSKSKEHRSLSQKLSSSEQTSHRHRSNLAPSKHEIGHDERYSEEESELDSNKTKEVNLNVNDKEVVMVSSKIKDTNPSSFPSGSNKQHIVEGGGGETKGSGRLSRFPPRPPRLPQYPGYSESSSESDDFGVGVSDNPFMHNPISTSSNNGADRKMDVDADEDKYKDFRDDDDDGGDGVGDNAKIDSPEDSKPPGKPFYFPSIQGCRSVEEFECLNRIEEGTYGVVYRARDKKVNEIVALKRLKMEKERDGFPITSLREINMLMKAQHENIVTVREVVVGSNMDKIYLVMDYVEHDLKSLMEVSSSINSHFLLF